MESDQGPYGAAYQAWGGSSSATLMPGAKRAGHRGWKERARAVQVATAVGARDEGEARLIESLLRSDSRYRPGTRVFHQKSHGTVSLVEGER